MLLAHTAYKMDTLVALGVVAGVLAVSVLASLLRPRPAALPGSATGVETRPPGIVNKPLILNHPADVPRQKVTSHWPAVDSRPPPMRSASSHAHLITRCR